MNILLAAVFLCCIVFYESPLVSTVFAQSCTSGTVYAKIIKKTGNWAGEESFTIAVGSTVAYTSPSLVNDSERTIETCLPSSSNYIYTMTMKDSANDAWTDGAWIMIKDINDNPVLKYMMTEKTTETVNFALYSPINKSADWKFTSNFQSGWNQYNHAETGWTDITLGAPAQQAAGTQYFRKTFAGVTGMAAVDVQFMYAHGIVAYINGVEIFRDNMPAGDVSQGTMASGSYATTEYHGVIRPAAVAESSQSVLAVELHFTDTTSRTIDFNAFLSFGAGISSTTNCFVSYSEVTSTASGFTNPTKGFDFSRNTGVYISTSNLPKDIIAAFSGSSIPMVNGFRLWPNSSPNSGPTSLTIAGGDSATTSSWTTVVSPSNQVYTTLQWKDWLTIANPAFYKAFKITLNSGSAATTYMYDMQFLVCNSISTSIQYPESSYSFYARYDSLNLSPSVFGITGCQINPQLPNGVSIDSSCVITGSASASSPQTTYTITATAGTNTVSGSVTLGFTDCQGMLLRVLRTYKSNANKEAFRIRNTVNEDMLMEVPLGNNLPSSTDRVDYLCVTVDRFDVTVDCSTTYWESGSYLYIYAELPDGQEELILKARHDGYQNNDVTYYLRRQSVTVMEQWYYKMGDPQGSWYDDNTSGWSQAAKGSFPASTNTIQLYKKTINIDDLNIVQGIILNIRYKYGCIVYLNGHEAFRNNIPAGDISGSSLATGSYPEVTYHTVTLPGRFVNADGSNPVALLEQGTNMIAIGLVALTGQTASDFDATVRLMTNEPEAHIWQFTGSTSGMSGTFSYPFDGYYSNYINYGSCGDNSLTITLDNDRREWVNTIQIQNSHNGGTAGAAQFNLYGRNPGDADWTLLKQATGLTYSLVGQKRKVYFVNKVPYNQFKFENFATGNSASCAWKVQSLNLYATSVMAEPTPLSYGTTNEIYKGIEMSELIPDGVGYFDFSISPALPEGLSIDSSDGWISGTYNELMNATPYTVTAHKITGGSVTATFTLSCGVCTDGRSMMTVRIRADGFPHENSWKLFQGRGTSGTVVRSADTYAVTNNYYYLDFCLNDGLYTFQGRDLYGDGWSTGTGYTLTADVSEMELEIEELYGSGKSDPKSVSTTFSTFFPFQVGFTDWKVFQSGTAPENWNMPSFDDSTWTARKAAEIPNASGVTTYIRKSFQLSGINDYQVLNMRVKYAGGVVVYFNGNKVARFNLDENFDEETESIVVHDATVFSKFHIILSASGVQEGTNIVAFEIHRPVGTSSSEAFVFDATGVFGVETCSTVIDSYSSLESTQTTSGTLAGMMDLDPYTVGTLPSAAGSYIEWTVENLEGSKFNSFNILGASDVSTWVFEMYGYFNPEDPRNRMTMVNSNVALKQRTKPQISVVPGLVGFRKIRYEILQASGTTSAGAVFTAYCKASGAACPGEGFYPSVGEGQQSPGPCPNGYTGYSYRVCTSGALGEVQNDKCTYSTPGRIRYRSNRFVFVVGIPSTTDKPTYRNIITNWYIDEGVELPAGLTLNKETGEISGTPTDVADMSSYIIYGENPNAAGSVSIQISVRKGRCNAEGVFPVTEVDQVATYECSMQGSYVGTQTRACVLGATDGEWQKASGFCMSVATIVILVVVALIVIFVVVFILMRMGGKAKAVGGVKGKKTSKAVSKKSDKKSSKSVKV